MMTMKQAQEKCGRWREAAVYAPPAMAKRLNNQANRLEAKFRDNPDYESDHMWLLRMQSGQR